MIRAEAARLTALGLYGTQGHSGHCRGHGVLLEQVPRSKLVVVDYSDGEIRLPWVDHTIALAYFKRSLVGKVDGTINGIGWGCDKRAAQPCFPLDYAVRPANFAGLRASALSDERNIKIACVPLSA